jgi:signal transduction histidine kinase
MFMKKSRGHPAGVNGDARSPDDLEKVLAGAEKTIERLRRAESKRKKDQQTMEEITHDLKERMKELNCLYGISSIAEQYRDDLNMILHRIVEIIPPAWQYPEAACCRISLEGTTVRSNDFQETSWRQAQDILADGKKIGTLEVFYREEKPGKDEGPFLSEERSLLKVIAERIGRIVEEKHTGEALYNSEMKNIALLSAIPDLMFQIDGNGTFIGFHKGSFAGLRELEKRIVGKNIYCLADEEHILPRRILDQVMSTVRRTLESGNPQVYEQHTSLKGRGRDYEVRMVVCRENEVLCIVRDMTRRKQLEREILEISNREQRRIGQDLHDSLCQHLAGIGFMGKVLERKIASEAPLKQEDVSEIVNLIDQAITLTKGYARGLNPVELPADGLMFALDKLAENVRKLFGVSCEFVCDEPIYLHDNEMANHLYRIVQEAISNAIKHGKAGRIVISLKRSGPSCLLTVSDNGIGIRKARSTGKGMGLNIMRYRASMFGATVDMRCREQGGTDMVCSFQVGL